MLRPRLRFWHVSLWLLSGLGTLRSALAEAPIVAFDVEMVVECRDVTPPPAAGQAATHKLIEAVFRVSPSLVRGGEGDVTEIAITLLDEKSPRKTLAVADFLPKTELFTDIVDPIVIIKSVQGEGGLEASAAYQTISLGASGKVSASSSVQYNKLPPLSLLLASGTTGRGHGVFYKLKPTTQTTLEGQRIYSVIFRVPRDWKADWIFVQCKADGVERGVLVDREIDAGLAGYAVGLYLQGDAEAYERASALAEQQQSVLDQLGSAYEGRSSEPGKSWLATAFDRIGLMFRSDPTVGASALNAELAEEFKATPRAQVEKELPRSVTEQLRALEVAKQRLEEMSGTAIP